MNYTYYKIIDRQLHYKGEKYFRVSEDREQPVLMVALTNGDNKKGRVGIFPIKFVSFTSNYYFPNHSYNNVELCGEAIFYDKMKETINKLILNN